VTIDSTNKIDYLLQHITSLLTRDSDQILLEQLGIGYSQYKILRVLHPGIPMKQRFIASTLGQTEASISRQIDLLIERNLITRHVDPHNKRVRLISVTPKGRKISEATSRVLERFHENHLSGLTKKQQTELIDLLDSLHNKMCQNTHSPNPDYLSYLTDN
jgi:DNA-binding MarR family transcriptional regulator